MARKCNVRVEHQFFNGVKYYRYPDSKKVADRLYFKHQGKMIHREVWSHTNGEIPKGMHIHHKDENTANNAIGNLEMVSPKEHMARHKSEARSEQSRRHMDKIRHLTVAWHGSEEGLAWHREHTKRSLRLTPIVRHVCQYCDKPYKTEVKSTNKYCSGKCRAYARRESGVDDVTKTCPVCGKEYRINRYARTKTCSLVCGAATRRKAK